MFTSTFSTPTTIRDATELRARFGCDALYLGRDASVTLSGTITLGPNVVLHGANRFDGPVTIETGSVLTDVSLGADTVVRAHSVVSKLTAGARNLFGPFCFIRDDCTVADDCILGAHVEATRSSFGSGVKISHRAFIGDATLGDAVIIGAGVVFCNYLDGKGRRPTTVGKGAMIASGTMLVAPLTIGDGAVIAAGSVITKPVAAGEKVIQKRV